MMVDFDDFGPDEADDTLVLPEDDDGCETEYVDADDEESEPDDGPVSIPAWAERPHWLEGYLSSIGQDDLEQEDDE